MTDAAYMEANHLRDQVQQYADDHHCTEEQAREALLARRQVRG